MIELYILTVLTNDETKVEVFNTHGAAESRVNEIISKTGMRVGYASKPGEIVDGEIIKYPNDVWITAQESETMLELQIHKKEIDPAHFL